MAKRKRSVSEHQPAAAGPPASWDSRIFAGDLSLHELFQQQVRRTLDDSNLDEQAKQAVLVALSCPCCGAGGMNYTVKIDRRNR
jgi:hypothetical protein